MFLRHFCYLLLLMTVCACAPGPDSREVSANPDNRPNILFILTDDQGIGDLSLHGNDSIRTPNMDALLMEGAKFDRFYVSPVCAPTRASFLSGQYHPRTGAIFVTRRRETMAAEVVTIPEHLKKAGYRTGLFGKWHNGATKPYDPAGQGFDEFLGFSLGHFNDYFNGELENERNEIVPFSGDLTDILTDTAIHFMLEDDQPFFTMLTYQAPHTPVQVADDHWDEVKKRGLTDYNTGIYAMIESIDEQIGRLRDSLEAAGKWENTLVVFSTDNGPNGDRFRLGLKGTKGQVNEGSVRVPFSLRMPGNHPANGQLFNEPAAHIDLLPTLLEVTDLPRPNDLDGASLVGLLEGREDSEPTRREFIYTFKQGHSFTGYPGSMRNETVMLVARGPEEFEYYNLVKDPFQERDLLQDSRSGENGVGIHDRAYEMIELYQSKIEEVRPDPAIIAPPINLDAANGPVRLLAHEGEPAGETSFNDEYGWANDYFINLGPEGAAWPIETDEDRTYSVIIRYHLDTDTARPLVLSTDGGSKVEVALPPAITEEIPVADRVQRKEVFPRRWAEVTVEGLAIEKGASTLRVSTPLIVGGLWVKEIALLKY